MQTLMALARSRIAAIVLMMVLAACTSGGTDNSSRDHAAGNDWPYYHGSPSGTHYSLLDEINISNVGRLQLAWTYDTGDELGPGSTIESNPLIVDEKLFFISPQGRLINLNAATGREIWAF